MTSTSAGSKANKVLYVTGFWDLHKREGETRAKDRNVKPPRAYLELASKWLLTQNIDLLVYTDPEFVEPIRKLGAAASKKEGSLSVQAWPLENTPWRKDEEAIREAMHAHRVQNSNPIKDTFWYLLLGWTKSFCLRMAHEQAAASSSYTHVAWLDFGLSHVLSPTQDAKWPEHVAQHASRSRIELLCLNPWYRADTTSLQSTPSIYYGTRHYKVGGGFWIVPREMVTAFDEELRGFIRDHVTRLRIAVCEDELLGVFAHHAKATWFRFHYGDYDDILNVLAPVSSHSRDVIIRGVSALLAEDRNSDNIGQTLRAFEMLCALRPFPPSTNADGRVLTTLHNTARMRVMQVYPFLARIIP